MPSTNNNRVIPPQHHTASISRVAIVAKKNSVIKNRRFANAVRRDLHMENARIVDAKDQDKIKPEEKVLICVSRLTEVLPALKTSIQSFFVFNPTKTNEQRYIQFNQKQQ